MNRTVEIGAALAVLEYGRIEILDLECAVQTEQHVQRATAARISRAIVSPSAEKKRPRMLESIASEQRINGQADGAT